MKNLKKVLACVVALVMMLSLAVSAAFPDVAADASYAEAVNILNALQIMKGEDGKFRPDDTITRAEVVAVVMRAKGLEEASNGAKGPTMFSDVAADHWASGYINLASQSKVVNGFTDGTFRPSDPVNYEQAAKLLIALLGYTPKAEYLGGYPSGYLILAAQLKVTTGASGSAGQPAKRSVVARMVYNALDVNLMDQTVFSITNPEFGVLEGKTLLTEYLNVYRYEGIVTSSYLIEGLEEQTITMSVLKMNIPEDHPDYTEDPISANVGVTNASDFLGYYVSAFIGEDDNTGDDVVYAISPKASKNTVTVVDNTNVVVNTDLAKNDMVQYWVDKEKDSRPHDINFDSGCVYLVNGDDDVASFLNFFDSNDISGKVTFISNDSNDKVDYAIVTEYTDAIVVDTTDENAFTVLSKGGETSSAFVEEYGYDGEDVNVVFYKDGARAKFADIKSEDVLNIAANSDETYLQVFISGKKITGKITEKNDIETGIEYYIAGNFYKAWKNEIYNIGDDGVFYLDIDNKIVYSEAVESSFAAEKYALLYRAGKNAGGLDDDIVKLWFVNGNGEFKKLDLAQRVSVQKGGERENSMYSYPRATSFDADADKINEWLGELITVVKVADADYAKGDIKMSESAIQYKLFKYDTNSSGQITKLYILNSANEGKSNTSNDISLEMTQEDAEYSEVSQKLGKTFLKDNTVVFDLSDENFDEQSEVAVSTAKSVFSGKDVTCTYFAYDKDTSGEAKVLLTLGAGVVISPSAPLFVITGVSSAQNDDYDEVTKLIGYTTGSTAKTSIMTNNDTKFELSEGMDSMAGLYLLDDVGNDHGLVLPNSEDDLRVGDVIVFNKNAKGEVANIELVMSKYIADALSNGAQNGVYGEIGQDDSGDVIDYFGFYAASDTKGGYLYPDYYGTEMEVKALKEDSDTFSFSSKTHTINFYVVDLVADNVQKKSGAVSAGIKMSTEVSDKITTRYGYYMFIRTYDDEAVDVVFYRCALPIE